MPIQFHKMHGAGNDFVLLDFRQSNESLNPALAAQIADRRKGVGCDQVLVLKASDIERCAARYEVFNSDGGRAGQCGNGVRCIGLYLHRRGELGQGVHGGHGGHQESGRPEQLPRSLDLEGPAGIVSVSLCDDGEFECAMGEPRFDPQAIPIHTGLTAGRAGDHRHLIEMGGQTLEIGTVSMGNPHAVLAVEDCDSAPLEALGPGISRHAAFPDGCNAGFVEVLDRENIRLRVFERGTGETLACGSGACAAVAVLAMDNRVGTAVNVFLPGGHLVIKWNGPGSEMTMKGPAAHVFRGTLGE